MSERISAADYQKRFTPRASREELLHVSILEFLRLTVPDAFVLHPANEMPVRILDYWPDQIKADVRRSLAKAQTKNKKLGMVKGAPDLLLCVFGQFWAFEIKAEGGTFTPEQKAVGEAIQSAGGRWAVVRSIDDVQECLGEWRAVVEIPLRGVVA